MILDRIPQLQSKLARRLIAAVILGASAVFLGYNLYRNWQELRNYQWQFQYPYLLLAAIALILTFISNIAGWGVIIERLGGPRDFRKNTEIYCLAAHGKRVPGLFWYVAGRGYLYEQEGTPVSVTVQASLWEMVFQMLAGLTLYTIFWPVYRQTEYGFLNYALLVAVPLLLLTFSPSILRSIVQRVRGGESDAKVIRLQSRDKALWFCIYFLGWLTGGAILYFLAKAITSASLSLLPACWGFVALSGVISAISSIIPGGAGAREISLSLLLSGYMPLPVAIALALLFRVWILLGETILLIVVWSVSKSKLWNQISRLTQTDY